MLKIKVSNVLLMLLYIFFLLAVQAAKNGSRRNVVLIIFDDLRPALGGYGDHLAQTPHLDAFIKESHYFTRAYSQVCISSNKCTEFKIHVIFSNRCVLLVATLCSLAVVQIRCISTTFTITGVILPETFLRCHSILKHTITTRMVLEKFSIQAFHQTIRTIIPTVGRCLFFGH